MGASEMTEERRLIPCCPYCDSTRIHYNRTLHAYFCSKCKSRFPRNKLAHREILKQGNLPALMAKILRRKSGESFEGGC